MQQSCVWNPSLTSKDSCIIWISQGFLFKTFLFNTIDQMQKFRSLMSLANPYQRQKHVGQEFGLILLHLH